MATIVLRDGSRFTVRPLRNGERAAVAALFARLGESSRRSRFLGPKPRLGAADLTHLAGVDGCRHDALLALDEAGRPAGVARFVRDSPTAPVAEIAFAVADDAQGLGLGTRLAERLARRARARSIRAFRASVDAGNRPALALLQGLGPLRALGYEDGVVEVEVELAATS